jgi:hypothetical protein
MREQDYAVNNSVQAEQLEVSRVLRNTYGLLALTLAFSGVMAFVAQQMRVGYPNVFVVLIGFYGLFFLTNKLRDSAWGLVSAFALTGFMGFLLGPILNRYLGMQGGAEVGLRADYPQGHELPGWFHHRRLLRAAGCDAGELLLPDQRSATGDQRRFRAVLLGLHSVPDQRHHSGRRAQLHHGDHQPVCIDLQPVHQLVAAVRHHEPR